MKEKAQEYLWVDKKSLNSMTGDNVGKNDHETVAKILRGESEGFVVCANGTKCSFNGRTFKDRERLNRNKDKRTRKIPPYQETL